MSHSLRLPLAVAATLALSAIGSVGPAIAAATFSQQEVDQSKFIAVAAPYGRQAHQLLILEQVSNKRACWQEGSTTTSSHIPVEPLLLGFDFTGICGRSTDSNGYSLRMAGQDLGLKYSLRVVKRNNELVLIGQPNRGQNLPALEIGRTRGLDSGFAKIFLDPGWRLSKRVYNGRLLGHVYLTNDLAPDTLLPGNVATGTTPPATMPPTSSTKPATFPTTGSTGTATGSVTKPITLPAPLPSTRPTQPVGTVRPPQPTVVIPKTPATATVIPVPVPPPQYPSQPIGQPIGQPAGQPSGVMPQAPTPTSVPILVPPPEVQTRPNTSSVKLPTVKPAASVPPVTNSSRPLPNSGIQVKPASNLPPVTTATPPVSTPSNGGFVVPTIGEPTNSTQPATTPSVQLELPTVNVYQ